MNIIGEYDGYHLPKLETDRLILRTRTFDDVEDMFLYASIEDVADNCGFPVIKTLDDEIEFMKNLPKSHQEHDIPDGYGITIKGSDRVIGSVDFNRRHGANRDILEIGYVLHPDFWGRGYVPEAAKALIDIGFTLLNVSKMEIACHSLNERSQKVAEKLGFTLEARLRLRDKYANQICDELRYGLLKSEWQEQNTKNEEKYDQ
ncbi:GNAT family N-acetyltransferase [Carnobacteriaceae bacterium zg-ZUI78]|uniref:GNAT family N-acetyltransferase n=1 Tax=Granulicatella sp. zg-84 TaxID=2678503 RepID=UPI0013C26605|nr:GNAT family protein [Granulicatella sp. zg-84]MBS4751114.1 GNAT family N-acetyltransferase [Carnobacteriaceae bacterium zg-ZUI78]NEW65458.1 GNAT family N-acetyltransferase [Granulicatella sp. zg-84]QMI85252.1 GNAT family N-acetyltransferase [Carnobacteriaceae bacterium zg-84]